jgi:DNA-binding PadR family transcriptional regulator
MRDTGLNIDLRALAQSLKENVSKLGGFSPQQVREAAMSDTTLRLSILRALADGPKTGHQVILALKEESKFGLAPSAGSVYPLLENLVDTEMAAASLKKDRRIYSITQLGTDELANGPKTDDGAADSNSAWPLPKWVDLQGVVPRASARLAAVTMDVAKNGTREQQQEAAAIIDEARRQMHALLSQG